MNGKLIRDRTGGIDSYDAKGTYAYVLIYSPLGNFESSEKIRASHETILGWWWLRETMQLAGPYTLNRKHIELRTWLRRKQHRMLALLTA